MVLWRLRVMLLLWRIRRQKKAMLALTAKADVMLAQMEEMV